MGIATMLFDGGFTFGNFIADAFTIFMFILWFYLLIVVSGDLFRRHDVSGFAKVLWVIAFVLFSYIGVFSYLLTQGRAWRNAPRRKPTRPEGDFDTSSVSTALTGILSQAS